MKVELIDHMGSDLTVANAARVSFDKESEWESEKYTKLPDGETIETFTLKHGDAKLIGFLATHNHWSPFAHCFAQFRISAPIFVARQLVKHQVGLAWNEVSRRYVDSDPVFFEPENWRARHENKKQGSKEDEFVTQYEVPIYRHDPNTFEVVGPEMKKQDIKETVKWNNIAALNLYKNLLDSGVCPEQARMVLPQSMMTQWYWSGSLMAFARVCSLRCKPDSQLETRMVADQISEHMVKLFPVSWKALTES